MTDPRAYLTVAILLFMTGMAGFMIRRNVLVLLLSLELMLNAGALTLITFARTMEPEQALQGHTFFFLVVALAAAESAVGLSLIIALFRHRHRLDTDDLAELKG